LKKAESASQILGANLIMPTEMIPLKTMSNALLTFFPRKIHLLRSKHRRLNMNGCETELPEKLSLR